MNGSKLQSVLETSEFIKQASISMDERARTDFIRYIAENPFEGDLIPGTGGARKIRWSAISNGGKRAGVRVIYYYYDLTIPIFLFTVYKKNLKDNISAQEKAALKKIIGSIVENYAR